MMMTGGNQQEEKKEIVQNLIMEMAIHNNHGDNNTTSNNSHDNSNNSKGDDSSDNNNSNNGDHNNTSNNSDNNNNSRKGGDDNNNNNSNNGDLNNNSSIAMMSRKEKRKVMKKMKRKQVRKDIAMKEREEEEARLNDPEEQMKLVRLEQEEAERMARERAEFEEREKQFLRDLELKKLQEEEEEKQRKLVEESQKDLVNNENANDENEDDGWEYVEEGPAEIIWKGNEIIVKKKKVRVPKQHVDFQKENKESERPISNPLAPQSEVFEDYRNAQDVLETVAQQVPNFGTEQDKEHCPFHLKTGVCRFGARCSRVHFYPDKACTLLLKNMYHGPGLAWEQDEGLEYTDEEAEQSFEDFYEDVHTEFLKFGEIVNFKVCRNGSSHLRGNVYVHYRSLESAVLAYQSINGRYFAGKQLTCEYVNVTRWRVAICGEYMKSRLKTCSRGSACNFIHCFRNPGGDYEWADWDKPAPRYWLKSMAALFGHSGDRFTDEVGTGNHSRRSRSKGLGSPHRKNFSTEDDGHRRQRLWRYRDDDREANSLAEEIQGKKNTHQDYHCIKHRKTDNGGISDGSTDGQRSFVGKIISSRKRREPDPTKHDSKSGNGDPISAKNEFTDRGLSDRCLERSSTRQKKVKESTHKYCHKKDDKYDMAENAYAVKHHDKFYKHKVECFSQEKVDSSNIDCQHDTPDSEENKHHRRDKNNLRWMKNDEDLSSSTSEGSRLCRVKERKHNRRKSSKWKSKRSVTEIRSNENSLDSYEDRHHSYADRSSKLMTNISDSSDGGCRLGRDEKRLRKSSRLKTQTVTDTESDSDNARFQRHGKKHSRERKNDADLSYSAFEADRCGRYEKRPQKSRRTSSRSHKESDLADLKSNRERIDGEERHHRRRSSVKRHIMEPCSSKVDTNAYSQSGDGDRPGEKGEVYDGSFQSDVRCKNLHADLDRSHPQQERTDDQVGNLCGISDSEKCYVSSDGGLVPGSDLKRCGKGHILQINKTDEEATGSAKVDTCFVGSSYQDFDAEAQAELEMACRRAALKKLEEIRKDKDTQAAHNREPVESFKICARENVVTKGVDVSAVPEESGSGKLEPTVTPMKRRRV